MGARSPREVGACLQAHERRLLLLLWHLAGRAVRAQVEPWDLLQEVYLRVLARPEALPAESQGEVELLRYLTHVARHVVVDAARALRRRKRSEGAERMSLSEWSSVGVAASALATRAPGPRSLAASGEEIARLLAAFDALSSEHRRVLGLRQFQGLSAREAAARMGRSEAAVHSLFRRALAAWEAGFAPDSPSARGESSRTRRSQVP